MIVAVWVCRRESRGDSVRERGGTYPVPPPEGRTPPAKVTRMEIKQQLKLSQQLVMTPQLQQAIRLLQLSRIELIGEIRKELDANPVPSDDGEGPRARAATASGTVVAENGKM